MSGLRAMKVDNAEKIDGISLLSNESKEQLNNRQQQDYADHRRRQIQWLLKLGKDPQHGDGYAKQTAHQRTYRIDWIYRWVWEENGRVPRSR